MKIEKAVHSEMRIPFLYGYFMRCLLLTRRCPSQKCGKQQVDEEFCVKCSLLCRAQRRRRKSRRREEVSAPASFLQMLSHS